MCKFEWLHHTVSGTLSIIPGGAHLIDIFLSFIIVSTVLVHILTESRDRSVSSLLPPSHHRWSTPPNAKVLPHVTFSNGIAMENHICPPELHGARKLSSLELSGIKFEVSDLASWLSPTSTIETLY
jgi:hypothetical protein